MSTQFESPADTFPVQRLNREQVAEKAVRALDMNATYDQQQRVAKKARMEHDQATHKQTLAPIREACVKKPVAQGGVETPADPVASDLDEQTESFQDDPDASESDTA